jgi:hypothetical protein
MRLGDAMKIKWKAHAHLQELNWRKDKVDAKYDYIADVRVIWVGTLYGCLQKYRKVPKVEVEGWQSEYEVLSFDKTATSNFLKQEDLNALIDRPDFPKR